MDVEKTIDEKLREGLQPQRLVVENVSHQHAGHAGSPNNGQSHFNVTVVSERFEGLSRVARHKAVYALLKEEMAGPIHALALNTHTPAEVL